MKALIIALVTLISFVGSFLKLATALYNYSAVTAPL